MKRSEMIIKAARDYDLNYLSPDDPELLAKNFLEIFEKLGMLPPHRIPEFTEYGEPNGFKISENTWEE